MADIPGRRKRGVAARMPEPVEIAAHCVVSEASVNGGVKPRRRHTDNGPDDGVGGAAARA
ncbi:hypothetical protein GCM10010399_90020 [Dactylosporangium fulvum]|uniref:Uncharacterized protein n=1 Tax=Dactylosporangium fulvum TaxID=53359 RepID=A0ABY5W9I4_9ACTN|nr:hypothetical protein [Dactylosporangium fulvum]UWP85679.1 hypothetical protein Dfulv_16130 [Dactylosporangium fulvum]